MGDSNAKGSNDSPAIGPDAKVDAGSIVRRDIQRQGSNELGIEYLVVLEIQPSFEAWQSNANRSSVTRCWN